MPRWTPPTEVVRIPPWLARHDTARWFALWLFLFAALTLLLMPFARLPAWWDAIGYVIPHALEIREAGFLPILSNYDVGHPTAFFWLLAIGWAITGSPIVAGHLLTWAFASLLLCGVFGCARSLGLSRTASTIAAMPLTAAMTLQILPDLPMAAACAAALWAWNRRRVRLYFFFGSLACLLKFHGFLVVCGPMGCVLLTAAWGTVPPPAHALGAGGLRESCWPHGRARSPWHHCCPWRCSSA